MRLGDNDRNADDCDADDDGDSAESDEYDDGDSDTNDGIECELKSASEALHSTKLAFWLSGLVKINEKCIRRTRKQCHMPTLCTKVYKTNNPRAPLGHISRQCNHKSGPTFYVLSQKLRL